MCHGSPTRWETGWVWKILGEIMTENSPNLAKDVNLQIQEAEWTSNRLKVNEIHTRTHHNITSENWRQEKKILKPAKSTSSIAICMTVDFFLKKIFLLRYDWYTLLRRFHMKKQCGYYIHPYYQVPPVPHCSQTVDFLSEIMEDSREWYHIVQVLKEFSTQNSISRENFLLEKREKLKNFSPADLS